MEIRIGFDLTFESCGAVPMMLAVNVHPSRRADLITPDTLMTEPDLPIATYEDSFGNICTRLVAPTGRMRLFSDAVVKDTGKPDLVAQSAAQVPVQELPDDTLVFLLGSRYCETDRLSQTAWNLFGNAPLGWSRVQSICDFVHHRIAFGYQHARSTKTAYDAFEEKAGVCRDFTHLAVTLCRCMNIPARYCTGYISDIGQPPPNAPMDFAAWFEAYLDGGWYTFDPRNNQPRIGRVLMARGRDAADVAISNAFGSSKLVEFKVVTDEIKNDEHAAVVA